MNSTDYTRVRLLITPISGPEAPVSYALEQVPESHDYTMQLLNMGRVWGMASTESGMEMIEVSFTDEMSAYEVTPIEDARTAYVIPIPVNPNPDSLEA